MFQHLELQVRADVRMIKSEQFATDWSLRFPRIQRIRDDKSASEIQTHEDFKDMVQRNRGTSTGRYALHACMCLVLEATVLLEAICYEILPHSCCNKCR